VLVPPFGASKKPQISETATVTSANRLDFFLFLLTTTLSQTGTSNSHASVLSPKDDSGNSNSNSRTMNRTRHLKYATTIIQAP